MKLFLYIMVIVFVILNITIVPVRTIEGWNYPPYSCKEIALDTQREYGGTFVFIEPLDKSIGHYENFIHGKVIDAGRSRIFNSPQEALNEYINATGKNSSIYEWQYI